ncbi:transcriptional regulator, GntR family [Microbulbifer donghaiensis]|uniref:Transcriptional regulator, GntR family n=1 Tax=Microbulbifer donghaiensis TaxID=494016 RepID=A0A1M4UCE0_9GAMM|nr:GntR family transcriptional regulator [Microbulbifer donghaiensis]SHE54395.1 transcriptional regulator, GntR family [Microbulbifer donghaiensis]
MTITEFIKSDVKAVLMAQGELPYKLTLGAMSEHYKVSLTPVRHAIDELVDEGVIRRKDNGRLELVPDALKGCEVQAPAPAAYEQNLEEQVRKDVIARSLQQDTEYLREQVTAEKYGAGRTVVRQIFSRLAGAGLIEHVPRCGWRVRAFSEQDMHDYLDIREMLELKALELARSKFDEDELRELLRANRPARGSDRSRLDLDLHDYWIERCGNRYIREFFARYSPFYNALFNYAVIDEKVKKAMASEHCEIIERLLEKDWKGARQALSHHIREQREAVSRMIDYLNSKRLAS